MKGIRLWTAIERVTRERDALTSALAIVTHELALRLMELGYASDPRLGGLHHGDSVSALRVAASGKRREFNSESLRKLTDDEARAIVETHLRARGIIA